MTAPSAMMLNLGALRNASAMAPASASMSVGLRCVVMALAVSVAAGVGWPGPADAQVVNSDYMAYPKNMTLIDRLRQHDQLQLTFARWPGLSTDYKLGPGDEITIRVFGADVMDQELKVGKNGTVVIPLVGDVVAAGLTAGELEQAIASRLREGGLIRDPQVLVYVTGYEAKQLFVFGAVDRPGLYQMSQDLTVMDAIFMAGGIDPNAGNHGYIHRKVAEVGADWPAPQPLPVAAAVDARTGNVRMASPRDLAQQPGVREMVAHPATAYPGTEVLRFDITDARRGGVVEPNLVLKPGDIVVISEETKDFFYVIGDVKNPSAIQIPTPSWRKVLASQAIAWAGGPSDTARISQGVLIRVDTAGRREEFKLDFNKILRGQQPDMEVNPNDVIFIPGSASKTLALGILGALPQTALANAADTIR
jgi:protein involved in polysaccharide export with SLBB domain